MAQLVERETGDRRVAGSSRTTGGVTVLCSWARHFIRCLILVQHRKTRLDMTEKNIDWDVKNQTKQTKY